MTRNIRSELYKALSHKMLHIAIGIGTLLCMLDVIQNITKIQSFNETIQWAIGSDLRLTTSAAGYSLFYLWMGLHQGTYGSNLYTAIWPVLAAMAYGWSYNQERRSGVYNQIVSRTSAKAYYVSKYVAVFASGGLAVAVPLLLNLLGNALVCPYVEISPIFNVMGNCDFLSELYYTCPWVYGLVWCGMVFCLGGATACLCLTVGTLLRHGVMIMLVPYAFYIFWDAAVVALRPTLFPDLNLQMSPFRMITVLSGLPIPEWLLFSALAVLVGGSFTIGYWQVMKHELV